MTSLRSLDIPPFRRIHANAVALIDEWRDADDHEAVVTEATDDYEPDTVIQEIVAGYRLGDKLIRPALVKVATRK